MLSEEQVRTLLDSTYWDFRRMSENNGKHSATKAKLRGKIEAYMSVLEIKEPIPSSYQRKEKI